MTENLQLPENVPPLGSFYVYMTGGCNLACQHCWIAPTYQAHGDTGGHISYEQFCSAIDQGIPLGLSHVKFTGGEPLLHPEFKRFVEYLRSKGISMSMETNATLMTADLAEFLRGEDPVNFVSVSLDGPTAEIHDPFRGVKGSFDRAVQGIRHMVNAGFRPQIIMSVHAGNVDAIEALVNLAVELGASSVKFNLVQPSGRGKAMTERSKTLDVPAMIELGKWITKDLQKRVPVNLVYSWPMAWYSSGELFSNSTYSCSITNILGILPTGHLAMCGIGYQIPELVYGRLGENDLADVWANHPMLTSLRADFPHKLEGICGECILRDQCKGTCVAENYSIFGGLMSPFWFCQTANELGLFPASRKRSVAL